MFYKKLDTSVSTEHWGLCSVWLYKIYIHYWSKVWSQQVLKLILCFSRDAFNWSLIK